MGILNLEELKKQIKEGTFTSLADVENVPPRVFPRFVHGNLKQY